RRRTSSDPEAVADMVWLRAGQHVVCGVRRPDRDSRARMRGRVPGGATHVAFPRGLFRDLGSRAYRRAAVRPGRIGFARGHRQWRSDSHRRCRRCISIPTVLRVSVVPRGRRESCATFRAAFAVPRENSSASSRPGGALARADNPTVPAPICANVQPSRAVISMTMLYSVRMARLLLAVGAATLLVAMSATGSALAGPSLDDVVRGVESAYGRMTDLKADFNQTSFNKSLNSTIPAQGAVYLKKGGKLRWEYSEPTKQEIVSDGKKLWVYTPQLNQVNVGDAPEALAGPAGSFLAGLGKVHEHFNVRFLNPAEPTDGDGNVVLDLTPKQPLPTMARLVLALDPKTWEVRKAIIYDQFENTVNMRFTRLAVNSGLPDTLFTFVPPAGVATVPLR